MILTLLLHIHQFLNLPPYLVYLEALYIIGWPVVNGHGHGWMSLGRIFCVVRTAGKVERAKHHLILMSTPVPLILSYHNRCRARAPLRRVSAWQRKASCRPPGSTPAKQPGRRRGRQQRTVRRFWIWRRYTFNACMMRKTRTLFSLALKFFAQLGNLI